MTSATAPRKPPRPHRCSCGDCRTCRRRKAYPPIGASRILHGLGLPQRSPPAPSVAPIVPGAGGCEMDRACPMPGSYTLDGRRCCLYHQRLFGHPEIMGRRREEADAIPTHGWRRPEK